MLSLATASMPQPACHSYNKLLIRYQLFQCAVPKDYGVNTVNISLSKALPLASMNHAIGDFTKYAWVYLFHRNCTPNFSKGESHALHISIVKQKTGPGIPSELHSGDSSRFSCFYMPMTSFQAPLKMCGARTLTYFLKFPIHTCSNCFGSM